MMIMITFIKTYLLGVLLTWILCKTIRSFENQNKWVDKKYTLIWSLFSFFAFFLTSYILFIYLKNRYLSKFDFRKLLNWL